MTEPKPAGEPGLGLEEIQQLIFSFIPSRVLAAGVQFGVFAQIAAGRQTPEEIAQAAGTSRRGTRMLLDALVAAELLTKNGRQYRLTPGAAQYLVPDSPDYVGGMMEQDASWLPWNHLAEAVRSGKPHLEVEQQQNAEAFFPRLVRTLHVFNREPARRAAAALGAAEAADGRRVLDVACGSGVWGIAFAEAHPQTRVTAQDFPGMLEETRQYLKRHGVEGRYDFLPGDLKQAGFGRDRYDVALLGNIAHSEGERSTRDLFRRLFPALRKGGRIAIVDMIPHDDRSGPPFPVFFALQMLLHSEQGDTYTLAEYSAWLREAGFARVETADIGSHSPLIVGHRG